MRALTIIAAVTLGFSTPSHAQSGWDAVGEALGKKGSVQPGEVYRTGFPRSDMNVTVGGVEIEPGLGLGTWVAFKNRADEAVVMGDLVLAEDEVTPVMERLLEGGVEVTALHKHLIGDGPTPMYMHIGGEGDPVELAQTIRSALELTSTPLEAASGASKDGEITFDTAAVDQIIGADGEADGGIYKYSIPRADPVTMHGMEIPAAMGSAIAINFQPTGDGRAAATGDFVMTADEVQPVLQALTANDIAVMPLHNHMLEEKPRLFFVHFWGEGDAQELARGLRAALEETAIRKE